MSRLLDWPVLFGPGLFAVLMAFVVPRIQMPRTAYRVAFLASLLVLIWTSALATAYFGSASSTLVLDSTAPRWFGIDGFTAPLLPFEALLALAALVAAGRGDPKKTAGLLAGEGVFLLLFASLDLDLVCVLWVASFLPGLVTSRRGPGRRAVLFVALGSTVPLLIARVALALDGRPTHLPTLLLDPIEHGGQLFFWGIMAAVAVRTALFPFHTWLLVALEHGSLPLTLLMLSARPGAFLLARVATPIAPEAASDAMLPIAAGGLVTALYGGLLGIAQEKPRRAIGAIAISHSGLIVIGLCSGSTDAITGALVQWTTVGVAVTGLGFIVACLEVRLGDLTRVRGLSSPLPGLSVAFILFGVASVGFPGTLGFVGEDLLIHGVLESHPRLAAAMIVSTSLNGITLMRMYMRTFLGPVMIPAPNPVRMRPRERIAALALIAVLIGFGLAPSAFVHSRTPAGFALPVLQANLPAHHAKAPSNAPP
ncbi:MAG: hypothetical protein HY791_17420 [Deltaproteobacteria bacterium]|nr:hypothetical protein [Deltaproteobacteria bacterium]